MHHWWLYYWGHGRLTEKVFGVYHSWPEWMLVPSAIITGVIIVVLGLGLLAVTLNKHLNKAK